VLAISDQPDGEAICAEVYGDRAALVPYIMPGFALAKQAGRIYRKNPGVEGLILLKHGIFSFGVNAREAYERMIALVSLAEARLDRSRQSHFAPAKLSSELASVAQVAPILRGLLAEPMDQAEGTWRRLILDFRGSPAILDYVGGADVARYSQQGVVTPDHTIRTKNAPLVVPAPAAGDPAGFATGAKAALERFVADYHAYFARHNGARGPAKVELDPMPRVILVPGLGLFGAGKSVADARIAADPAKLGKGAEKPLSRQVALVTGGGGGIGEATADAFADAGAAVAVVDLDGERAGAIAARIGGGAIGLQCDVTDRAAVDATFDRIAETYGGLDILISNAGAAWQGEIGEVADEVLRASFELNFFAHQSAAQAAVRIMKTQGTGGILLFNASKQAVNPGADFGPYGLPKAATLFLSRQYALEYGAIGIRSNAVNADRVNTGIFADGLLEERAAARGLTPEEYLRTGNLLQREVKVADVANAFLHLALSPKTTGAVLTVDGGNIAAALR
jgi:NAD(P)-dependent dehydrogenase (short-subunit alcohol dehydrogenase family)